MACPDEVLDVTLATPSTYKLLDQLIPLLHGWNGKISLSNMLIARTPIKASGRETDIFYCSVVLQRQNLGK